MDVPPATRNRATANPFADFDPSRALAVMAFVNGGHFRVQKCKAKYQFKCFLENCQKIAYRRAFLKILPEFGGENRHGRRRSPQHLAGNLEFTSTFLCGKLHFYSFFIHFLFICFHILSHFCSEPRRNSLRRNEHLKNEPNVGTARVYILQTTHRDRHGSMTPARDSEKFLARISYVSFFVWYILYSIL